MNLLLLAQDQMKSDTRGLLSPRQTKHIASVLKLKRDDKLRVGLIGNSAAGPIGEGRLLLDPDGEICEIEIEWLTQRSPPPVLDLTVCVALPRPKALRRLLFALTVQGAKRIHVFHAYRVEKSYWTSPLLSAESVKETFIKGLEQAGDTQMPTVDFHQRFRPFVEDELPTIAEGKQAFVLDKRGDPLRKLRELKSTCVIIGPEGGFIDFELALLKENGFASFTMGTRILTVEIAAISFTALFSGAQI